MGFEEQLVELSEMIDSEIRRFFSEKIVEAEESLPFLKETYEHLQEYVLRKGKRLASACTLMAYQGIVGGLDPDILRAAVSVELFRHGILVHDDLVDVDDLRRGKPSLHEVFKKLYLERYGEQGAKRFGDSTAVFAGNILVGLCCENLERLDFPHNTIQKVLGLVTREYRRVNDSQVLDLLFEAYVPSVSDWFVMARTRAPSLFRTSILAGAILGNANDEQYKVFAEYAENVGYAFDIQDDIIGTFASEKEYGRPPVGDVRLGKKTLFMIKALELAPEREKKRLLKIMGKPATTIKDVDEVRQIVKQVGGLEAAKSVAEHHAKEAKRMVGAIGMRGEAEAFFSGLADFIVGSMEWYV